MGTIDRMGARVQMRTTASSSLRTRRASRVSARTTAYKPTPPTQIRTSRTKLCADKTERNVSGRRRSVKTQAAALPLVGNVAPDFKATAVFDQEFVDVTLSQYKGKYVVLFFYPLGCSVDSEFSHLAWVQTDRKEGGLGDIAFPIVSDLKKQISEAYGVLNEEGVALRGLFIIDREGVVQHATINNLAFGRSVDETLRVLQALQYVQDNPDEVCPAGWKPGEKTMKPDPSGSKEYFAAI